MGSYYDDFNRADSNSLGGSWSESEGDATAAQIVSNRLRCNGGATSINGVAVYSAATGNDQDAQLTWRAAGSTSNGRSGPGVRCSGTNASFTGYACFYDGGAVFVRKYSAEALSSDFTAGTTLGSFSVTLASGDTVRIEIVGSRIRVYVNGIVRIDVTDSGIATGTAGVVVNRRGAGANVWTEWDDFIAHDAVIPGGASSSQII